MRIETSELGRRVFLLTTGAGVAVYVTSPGQALAGQEAIKPFLGSYRHAGGDKEREDRDKAIDDVVAGMNVFARGIARDRLKASNPIAAKLEMSADAKALTIAMDTRSYTAPLDGSWVKVKAITGDEMDMRFKIADSILDQIFSGDERGRVNAFRPSSGKLVMNVRVHASKLPKDLVYKLTYERS
jgi:hypothetical protein